MALQIGSLASGPAIPPAWFNVKDFGAVGDFSHDDTGAIQAAMNALKANVHAVTGSMGGQTLYFPPGYYLTSSRLDFTSLAEVRILGGSGRGGGFQGDHLAADANPPTVIALGMSSSSAIGVDMSGSAGCVWDGVSIVSRGTSYTGKVLSLDTVGADIFGNRLQNCVLNAVSGSGPLISLAGNIEFSADNVVFLNGEVHMVDPTALAHWSNANSFRSCSFGGARTNSILNPGPQTTLIDCTFEPNGTVPAPIAYTALGNEAASCLTLIGCGFWDNSGSTGSWLTSTVATDSFAIIGCKWEVSSAAPAISLSSHTGLAIMGTRFDSPGGGTPNVFDPAHAITNGRMMGCNVVSPVVNNNVAVGVTVL